MTHLTAEAIQPTVKIGQIWEERDGRYTRRVEIIGVDGDFVFIQGTCRVTKAKLSRFNGKSGGYRFLGEDWNDNSLNR